MNYKETITARVDYLLDLGKKTLATSHSVKGSFGSNSYVDKTLYVQFLSAARTFLKDIFGEKNPYFQLAPESLAPSLQATQTLQAILLSVKNDLQNGWLESTRGLIAGEVFTDFMDMGKYLLDEGYKDAAAVIIGSTLEGHLRSMSVKNSLALTRQFDGKDIPLKADVLNAQLAAAGVYSKTQQKLTTGWLGLRNDAAHGHYGKYSSDNVKLMYEGVLQFIAQTV